MNNNEALKLRERILSRIKYSSNGCWEWTGGKRGGSGYGCIKWGGKVYNVHRIFYEITLGDTNGKLVCHECDNKICINPGHLYLGTYSDNRRDAIKRDRWKPPLKGQKSPHGTITRYRHHGCRCEMCRNIGTIYTARLRRQKMMGQ